MDSELTAVQPSPDTAASVQPAEQDTGITEYASGDQSTRIAMMQKWGMLEDKEPQKEPETKQEPQKSEGEAAKTPTEPEKTPEGEQLEGEGEQLKPYTPEEIKATEMDKLDYKRLPPELQPFYNSMRAAQVRKDQETAEQKKLLKELVDAAKQPAPMQQQQQRQTAEQAFTQRHNFLKNQVELGFALPPGELDHDPQFWTPEQRLAYGRLDSQLASIEEQNRRETQTAELKAQQAKTFAQNVEAELIAADPEAYEYTMGKIRSGEILTKDREAIVEALETGDKKTITQYFEKFRKEFRKVPDKPKKEPPAPPVLESGGQGASAAKNLPKVDEFRGADRDTRVKLMKQWGLVE